MTEQKTAHCFAVGDVVRLKHSHATVTITEISETDDGRLIRYHRADGNTGSALSSYFELVETKAEVEVETPAPPADWRKDPAAWLDEMGGAARSAIDVILDGFTQDSGSTDALAVIRLLEASAKGYGYKVRQSHEYLRYGSLAVPTTPTGIATVRQLRTMSQEVIGATLEGMNIDPDSVVARLLTALDKGAEGSGVLGGVVSQSEFGPDAKRGIRLDVNIDRLTVAKMPRGEDLPAPMFLPNLVGLAISGDEVDQICSSANLCADGVSQFLSSHGISHDGGAQECDSCGQMSDTDCADGMISYCEDFELTQRMVDDLEREGHADALRDALVDADIGACASDFDTLLEECDDSDLLAMLKPKPPKSIMTPGSPAVTTTGPETGIVYDPKFWRFDPNFESIEGLDDVDFEGLTRLLPAISKALDIYVARKILPPIAGDLVRTAKGFAAQAGDATFAWDPDSGTLTHRTRSDGAALVWSVVRSSVQFKMPGDGAMVSVDQCEPGYFVTCPADSAGDYVSSWFSIGQAKRLEL